MVAGGRVIWPVFWVQMEQTTLANKPNIPLPTRDHFSDPPNKLAIAVI